jgi:hypothetical protein
MNVDKQNSIDHIRSRFGDETAQVYTGLVKKYPETIPMDEMFRKFSKARRIVQAKNPVLSPAVASFRSQPVDTATLDMRDMLDPFNHKKNRMRRAFMSQDLPFNS